MILPQNRKLNRFFVSETNYSSRLKETQVECSKDGTKAKSSLHQLISILITLMLTPETLPKKRRTREELRPGIVNRKILFLILIGFGSVKLNGVYLFFCVRCDRILWHGDGIRQLSYVRGESRFSDHRPVCSVFVVDVEVCEGKTGTRRQ